MMRCHPVHVLGARPCRRQRAQASWYRRAPMATRSSGTSSALAKSEAALRAYALAKPEATEHFPWGERAIKVKGKVFLFMYADATRLSLSTKLPDSSAVALLLPFAKPTGYGLGKAGWVSASFEPASQPPVEMLCAWIDESYQAVAPAKLAALARGAATPATAKPASPRAKPASPRAKPASPRAKPASPRAKPASPRAKPASRTAATR
jgi:predicted DNA-binding protein (MmcQ/YjbR family)